MRLPSGSVLSASPATAPPQPAILFLHGVGGGAWSWEPQMAAFSHRPATYVWEARGHGAAAAVADAGLAEYFADAREALTTIARRDGPAFVVGHSMGGLLALALAAEMGAFVRGLVLIDPVYAPSGGRHGGASFAWFARRAIVPLVTSMKRDGRLSRALSRRVFAAAFRDRDCMRRAWLRQRTQVPVEYPKMMYEAFDGPSGFPNRAFAREVEQPTLLLEPTGVRGSRLVELANDLAPLRERFTAIALDGGHYLQLDRTAECVTRELSEFVARW